MYGISKCINAARTGKSHAQCIRMAFALVASVTVCWHIHAGRSTVTQTAAMPEPAVLRLAEMPVKYLLLVRRQYRIKLLQCGRLHGQARFHLLHERNTLIHAFRRGKGGGLSSVRTLQRGHRRFHLYDKGFPGAFLRCRELEFVMQFYLTLMHAFGELSVLFSAGRCSIVGAMGKIADTGSGEAEHGNTGPKLFAES